LTDFFCLEVDGLYREYSNNHYYSLTENIILSFLIKPTVIEKKT